MRIGDWLLRFLQQRCDHPDYMVASDILEGVWDIRVKYCNRCGAVCIAHDAFSYWRRPDPYLWIG